MARLARLSPTWARLACLVAVAASAVTLFGAGCAASDASRYFRQGAAVPDGCAVGVAGPTLHKGSAILLAETDALEGLAMATGAAPVHLRAIEVDHGDDIARYRSVLVEHLEGRLAGARVVRLWRDVAGDGSLRAEGLTYAMACTERGARALGPWETYEALLHRVSRPCALGLAGPTIVTDQRDAAFGDARGRLARLLDAHVEAIHTDYDLQGPERWQGVTTGDASLAYVESHAELEAYVVDEAGDGPLALPGLAYALACLKDGR